MSINPAELITPGSNFPHKEGKAVPWLWNWVWYLYFCGSIFLYTYKCQPIEFPQTSQKVRIECSKKAGKIHVYFPNLSFCFTVYKPYKRFAAQQSLYSRSSGPSLGRSFRASAARQHRPRPEKALQREPRPVAASAVGDQRGQVQRPAVQQQVLLSGGGLGAPQVSRVLWGRHLPVKLDQGWLSGRWQVHRGWSRDGRAHWADDEPWKRQDWTFPFQLSQQVHD